MQNSSVEPQDSQEKELLSTYWFCRMVLSSVGL